ncbi:thioesterase family protein [Corynebacterium sp. 11A]|uniref:thioesterase family protein n=1 Tax=Corynebacterium sp. 11A TaxID=2080510 RepID=UPI00124E8691|nr:thioesterase family protein [Corynebacterium sp. 11A]
MSSSYFTRTSATEFVATELTAGAWNPQEIHIAPALGLLTHILQEDFAARRPGDTLDLSRISFDILGTAPIGEVRVDTEVIRPGRTIELVQARLIIAERPVVIARGWFSAAFDTGSIESTALKRMPSRYVIPSWNFLEAWEGAFVDSVDAHRTVLSPGHAQGWLSSRTPLLEGVEVSPLVKLMTVMDIVNGLVLKHNPKEVAYPNIDLSIHLFRSPEGHWFGADTTMSIGPAGHGLTHTHLHDEKGPIGVLSQTLTVRP